MKGLSKIKKIVQYVQTQNEDIFNLAFGNLDNDGSIDDETTNDNKDRNKILATVAATIYEFTAKYTDKTIFFCGTTPERTQKIFPYLWDIERNRDF